MQLTNFNTHIFAPVTQQEEGKALSNKNPWDLLRANVIPMTIKENIYNLKSRLFKS